jgi:putative Holliday junction resolvase
MDIYLGVDWGISKIGLAIADSENRVAVPIGVVKNLAELVSEIKSQGITKIILGHPIAKDGRVEHQALAAFQAELTKLSGLPIEIVDERLTTRLAIELRHQAPGTAKHKAAAAEDAIAAMLILETYLSRN